MKPFIIKTAGVVLCLLAIIWMLPSKRATTVEAENIPAVKTRTPRDIGNATGRNHRTREQNLHRLHLLSGGEDTWDHYTNLKPELVATLREMCDRGDFAGAVNWASKLEENSARRFLYTVFYQWAKQDKDGSLAWLKSSSLSDEYKERGLEGILGSALEDSSAEGIAWVKDMLQQTRAIPGFKERLDQVAKGWIVTGAIGAGEYVSWWRQFLSEDTSLNPNDVFSSLYHVAFCLKSLYQPSEVAAQMQYPSEATTIAELATLGSDLNEVLNELTKSVRMDGKEVWEGQLRGLVTTLGEFAAIKNELNVPLDAYIPPDRAELRIEFFRGVGFKLSKFQAIEVAQLAAASKNPETVDALWGGYIEQKYSDQGAGELIQQIGSPEVPDALKRDAAIRIADEMIKSDSLGASKEIAAQPAGFIRTAMIGRLVKYLMEHDKPEEAKQWQAGSQ